jgi:dTDP-4-dehydrorhamnose reductase
MRKLLVTGASGFLGWNVCRAARHSWDVFGIWLSHPVAVDKVKLLQADLADPEPLHGIFNDIRPDAVVHCAAYPEPDKCQLNPDVSYRINVQASLAIASLCATAGIPCVFTSSDLVFGGDNAPYDEESRPGPVNIYGEHKLAAERGMLSKYPDVTICRMPLMFGDAVAPAKSSIQPLIASLVEQRKFKLFTDEYRTPVSGATAARGLLLALEKTPRLLHCGGREHVSRYDIGVLVAKAIGKDPFNIIPALQKESTQSAPRPRDVSLVSEKAFDLGYDPKTLEEQIGELECVKAVKAAVKKND